MSGAVTRRELPQAAGLGGVAVGFPGLLSACGSAPELSVDRLERLERAA